MDTIYFIILAFLIVSGFWAINRAQVMLWEQLRKLESKMQDLSAQIVDLDKKF